MADASFFIRIRKYELNVFSQFTQKNSANVSRVYQVRCGLYYCEFQLKKSSVLYRAYVDLTNDSSILGV